MARNGALTQGEINEILSLYEAGHVQTEIAIMTHRSMVTVSKYIIAAGLGKGRGGNQKRKVTDAEILEDIAAGLTRQEIADKHGIHVENLARRMRNLGVSAKKTDRSGKSVYARCGNRNGKQIDWHWTPGSAKMVERFCGDRYELVGILGGRMKLRCKQCGTIIERSRSTVREKTVVCDICGREAERQKYQQRLVRVLNLLLYKQTPRICCGCGEVFYSEVPNQKYCSQKCKAKTKSRATSIRERCRKYGVEYNTGISLNQLFIRDKGICQICGKPCDKSDNSWNGFFGPLSPTIDHRVALANGGSHSWDNVQLAHAICNSYKRDLEVSA